MKSQVACNFTVTMRPALLLGGKNRWQYLLPQTELFHKHKHLRKMCEYYIYCYYTIIGKQNDFRSNFIFNSFNLFLFTFFTFVNCRVKEKRHEFSILYYTKLDKSIQKAKRATLASCQPHRLILAQITLPMLWQCLANIQQNKRDTIAREPIVIFLRNTLLKYFEN